MQFVTNRTLPTSLLVLAIGLGVCLPAASASRDEIREQLDSWLTGTGTPSAAVAYIEQGKVRWTLVTGEQAPGVAADQHTLYNVASLAKPVTAELLLRLSNEQPSFLDETAARYWLDPDIAGHDYAQKLTIKHLLSHQSGFPNWRYQSQDKLTFKFEPGTGSGYSGEGYQYLALAMQEKWQQPFEALMQKHLFTPLQMHNSAFTQKPWFKGRLAFPKGPKGEFSEPAPRQEFVAADDLYTTIDDYALFVASVVTGQGLNEPLASRRWSLDFNLAEGLCQSGRLDKTDCPQKLGFVMGWTLVEYGDLTLYMQGGGDWGERALAVMVPATQTGIVVLTNGAKGMQVVRKVVNSLFPHPKFDAFLKMQAEGS
ncbi:serine hydrolase domain-containing protein [Bowmanella dokdonensis]|uniref:Beta-lactamase family protein n=1 Tax=Bowmanella dokdonensis TaxID=751969 RepID=A0A939DRC9_9ALTE|nr:serine hydrolase domain-containing protein [Bowmanella dokdonensis]MBN7827568.1 beta-lactamase family protein [Bowmanella dokdonensis]